MEHKTPDDSGILMLMIYVCIGAMVVYLAIHMSGCGLFTNSDVQSTAARLVNAYLDRSDAEAAKKELEKHYLPDDCDADTIEVTYGGVKYIRLTVMCDWDIPYEQAIKK